jgi:uncharacterized phage protein gp47/JayE
MGEQLMPLNLPSMSTLQTQTAAGFAARLSGADTTLRFGVLAIAAKIIAGGQFAGFRSQAWLSRQLLISSAEAPYLDRRLADYGLSRSPPTQAGGTATFTGTNGYAIPANAVLQDSTQKLNFATQAAGSISSGSVTLPVLSLGAGAAYNLAAGAPLTLTSAIAGINPTGNVTAAGLTGGNDQESDASFRARGLARIQDPPQGGAATDLWQWARNSGVPTRAWVYPRNDGPGTAAVTFVIDTRSNIVPLAGDLSTVQTYVEALAPVVGGYFFYAPAADPLSVTIHGMVPNDAATQAAVVAAIDALVATVPPGGAAFGDGVTIALQSTALFPKQVPGTLFASMIEAAIDSVGTIASYDLVSPASDVTYAPGHLPAPPSVTFT